MIPLRYRDSGALKVLRDDGTEFECITGDVALLPSAHDARVVGDAPVAVVDFQCVIAYATS